MPAILTLSDVESIALATPERGRSSRFGYLAPYLRDLAVDGVLMLDDNDLNNYDAEVASIVAKCDDGVTLSKDDRAKMRNVLAAILRELRKIHGDDADIRSVYAMVDESPAFGVRRVK